MSYLVHVICIAHDDDIMITVVLLPCSPDDFC